MAHLRVYGTEHVNVGECEHTHLCRNEHVILFEKETSANANVKVSHRRPCIPNGGNMKHFSKLTLKQTGKVYFESTKYVFRLGKMSNDASLRNRMVLQGRCIVFLGCVFGCFCSITIKLWHT